ncbi:PHP domain-containing protein [Candidatus Woesearchaeota archaeon]|nr:PHP domain-containing protein [Candidatus Woesearchaeota archaeon]
MLKADLHSHSGNDPEHKLSYSHRELISFVSKLDFEIWSITNHDQIVYNKSLIDYAKRKGILLVPGVELTIEKKDVLIYNITRALMKKIKTFVDLEKYKDENIVVVAPHPFFPGRRTLGRKLVKNIKLFDGIEYSHFYLSQINFNRKAVSVAKKYDLPLIGTSDAHHLWQIDHTYSLIDCEKNIGSLIDALLGKKIKLVTKPHPFLKTLKMVKWMAFEKKKQK